MKYDNFKYKYEALISVQRENNTQDVQWYIKKDP